MAQQAGTGLSLKATAGLRLLPGDKADRILEAVTSFLKGYPFAVKQGAVGIMDGEVQLVGASSGYLCLCCKLFVFMSSNA